jgi:hypothetical protein
MRTPSLSDVLTVVLSCLAVATGALGAYLGTMASLVGLTAVLTARVLAGKTETRSWSTNPSKNPSEVALGPISKMTTEIREAAAGESYSRSELTTLLSWLSTTRSEGLAGSGPSELTTARRVLSAVSNDQALKERTEADNSLASSRLKGKSFIAALESEVDSIRDG